MSRLNQYWLHVPLETTPGMLLEAPPPDRRVTVRGRRAQLFERERHISFVPANALMIKQWLLFDSLPESEAKNLLADLRAWLPVVSMNMGANFRISVDEPDGASTATYDGTRPTLIPFHLPPAPAWADPAGSCSWNAQDVLERTLEASPPVTEGRAPAALELFITSQYDFLPRALFLAELTSLDALATRAKRRVAAAEWIAQKLVEAAISGYIPSEERHRVCVAPSSKGNLRVVEFPHENPHTQNYRL